MPRITKPRWHCRVYHAAADVNGTGVGATLPAAYRAALDAVRWPCPPSTAEADDVATAFTAAQVAARRLGGAAMPPGILYEPYVRVRYGGAVVDFERLR